MQPINCERFQTRGEEIHLLGRPKDPLPHRGGDGSKEGPTAGLQGLPPAECGGRRMAGRRHPAECFAKAPAIWCLCPPSPPRAPHGSSKAPRHPSIHPRATPSHPCQLRGAAHPVLIKEENGGHWPSSCGPARGPVPSLSARLPPLSPCLHLDNPTTTTPVSLLFRTPYTHHTTSATTTPTGFLPPSLGIRFLEDRPDVVDGSVKASSKPPPFGSLAAFLLSS